MQVLEPEVLDGVADRGQRVAQLVSQHGQELVLPPVALMKLAEQPHPLVGHRHIVGDRLDELELVVVEPIAAAAAERESAQQLPVGDQRVADEGPDARIL